MRTSLRDGDVLCGLLALGQPDDRGAGDELLQEGRIEPFTLLDVRDRGNSVLAGREIANDELAVETWPGLLNAAGLRRPELRVDGEDDHEVFGRRTTGAVGQRAGQFGGSIGEDQR